MAADAHIVVTLDAISVHTVLRSTAKVLISEGIEARKQMLAQVQDEQRAFWTGAYHAYMKAAAALNALALEYEVEKEDDDSELAPGAGIAAGDAGYVAPAQA